MLLGSRASTPAALLLLLFQMEHRASTHAAVLLTTSLQPRNWLKGLCTGTDASSISVLLWMIDARLAG
jgi:hypothetical protein